MLNYKERLSVLKTLIYVLLVLLQDIWTVFVAT